MAWGYPEGTGAKSVCRPKEWAVWHCMMRARAAVDDARDSWAMLTDMPDLVEVEVPSLKVLAVKFLATAEHGVEFNIETPRRGETTNALALFVSGWAGMAGRKISNVLIRTSRRTLICTRSPRPDLAGRFGASEAARAGFFAELRVFDLVGTAEAEIVAEIEGGNSCVLGQTHRSSKWSSAE